jgi:nicotinamidase-related amidase
MSSWILEQESGQHTPFYLIGANHRVAGQVRMLRGRPMSKENQADPYADPEAPGLPPSDVRLDHARAALVVVDPQIDFLSPDGVAWGAFGESITHHGTVPNIGRLFAAARQAGLPVVISPHYYYPHDHQWAFAAPGERLMYKLHMFDRPGALSLEGFRGSGADWMPEFKDSIEDGRTIVCSPHKIAGPQTNDVIFQLRKQKVDQVILAGMAANFCIESHLRDFVEHGFEVAVVRDATAGSMLPEGDGYLAALINFRYIANGLWTTDEAVARIGGKR